MKHQFTQYRIHTWRCGVRSSEESFLKDIVEFFRHYTSTILLCRAHK